MYQVTKTYGHERGISCAFRQHGASSHCRMIHGYALSFSFTFESRTLNSNNWVIDFGALKEIEAILKEHFDHKMLVSKNDPQMKALLALREAGIADLVFLEQVGCEAFARRAHDLILHILHNINKDSSNFVYVTKVTVSEHGANSASFIPSNKTNI